MRQLLYLGFLLSGDLILVLAPGGDLQAGAAFALLWVLPGLGWGQVLGRRWLEGLGLGMGINILLALLIHSLPGPYTLGLSLGLLNAAALLPWIGFRRQRLAGSGLRLEIGVVAIVLLAALFRFSSLSYSEFQGDEGVIMTRAAAALEGDDAELFLHQKGPVEILMPMASWRLSGGIDAFWARLPFAWASVLGVAALARLGERWLGRRAGWVAGGLMAINGFHIAFGRIVQYQSIVITMVLLGLLSLDRYRQKGHSVDLFLGAGLLALGVMSHYDALLFLPAAALLVLPSWPGRKRAVVLALLLALTILSLFYLPFVLNPNFGKTAGYLAGDRVGGGLVWNGSQIWVMSTVYNASIIVILLLVLLPCSMLERREGTWLAGVLFLVPFLFYLLVVWDPRTHVYTFFPGAILLAGGAVGNLWRRWAKKGRRWAALAVGLGVWVLGANYAWMLFVDHSPEYQRSFPENKSWLYPTTYDEMPLYGRFGFPHRAGWERVGALMASGELQGIYASNEEQEITDLYTRQVPRTHCPGAELYLVAERVQDPVPVNWEELAQDYYLAGQVAVEGEVRLRWYRPGREEGDLEPALLDGTGVRQWWRPEEVVPPTRGGEIPVDLTLGGVARLVGYDLALREARPGGWIEVILYWEALAPLGRNYQVFTHLYDGVMWGQHDGAPECGVMPTTRWEPGQIIRDPHRIPIAPEAPAGPIPLLVGMYDLITLDRLPVLETGEDQVHLADISLRGE